MFASNWRLSCSLGASACVLFIAASAEALSPASVANEVPAPDVPRSRRGDFDALNISLLSWVSHSDFEGETLQASDIWGYVSPAGREYAIIGLRCSIGFVEVSDPSNAVIIEQIEAPCSTWHDMKTFGEFAYAVTEQTGQGLQIIDLRQIDDGIVILHAISTQRGSSFHNIALDGTSGFAYTVGGNTGDSVWDLSDPANPQFIAGLGGVASHDAQVVTYTEGTYAGREIAYQFSGGDGLRILDVTNKLDIQELATAVYPGLSFCHQGWLSEDRRYLFIDDELDPPPTTTFIFNVEDPADPLYVTSFTNGLSATDHNLMVRGQFIFEANNTSGLRVFDASDINNVVEVGYFDTYPETDNPGFDGAWGVYTQLPSRVVLVSDRIRGLFVLDTSAIDGVVICATDVDCDDGLFCSGIETCVGEICQPGEGPCPGLVCVEKTQSCRQCVNDAECIDGNDCNGTEACDLENGQCVAGAITDCNGNAVDDACDLEACGFSPACQDCNGNGIPDSCDLDACAGDASCDDCNGNGIPDGCDIAGGEPDKDGDGVPDACAAPLQFLVQAPSALNTNAAVDLDHEDEFPQIATDRSGTWLVAWAGERYFGVDYDIVFARSTDNGLTWSDPALLNSTAQADGASRDSDPSIATDRLGNWVAVWSSEYNLGGTIGNDFDILAAHSTDNGVTWSDAIVLDSDAGSDGQEIDRMPRVATDALGNWVTVWHSLIGAPIGENEDRYEPIVARSTDNGATWTTPIPLSDHAGIRLNSSGERRLPPAIAANGLGHWIVIWSDRATDPCCNNLVIAGSADNGVTWADPVALNGKEAGGGNDIAVDGAGRWVAVWKRWGLFEPGFLVTRSADGATWDDPQPIDSEEFNDWHPQLATDRAGHWVAMWDSREIFRPNTGRDRDIVFATSGNNGATWGERQPFNTNFSSDRGDDDEFPDLATDGVGQWVAVWHSTGTLGETIGEDRDILVARFEIIPTGACCDTTVGACQNVIQDDCFLVGLEWTAGASCAEITCLMTCTDAAQCDDGIDCTTDTCDPQSHICLNSPNNALCDDGIACTSDSCDAQSNSCLNVPVDVLCDDNDPCNGNELCDPEDGGCVPGSMTDCNDNQIDDSCDLAQCDDDPACDDCNGNGVLDGCDLAAGEPDVNANGLIDACEPPCAADNANCDDDVFCTFDRCIDELCLSSDARYGDTAGPEGACGPDGSIDLFDIFAVLNAFQGTFRDECSLHSLDIAGCAPDGQIDLNDILAVLDAFQGIDGCCADGR